MLCKNPLNDSREGLLQNASSMRACSFSHAQLFVTPWTVAHQAPLSMEFSKQEYWSESPFLPPRNLTKPTSLVSPAVAGGSFTYMVYLLFILKCLKLSTKGTHFSYYVSFKLGNYIDS